MALTDEWKEKISEKLVDMFGDDDPETLTRVLWSLNQEDSEPKWKSLKLVFNKNNPFELFANRIAKEDAKKELQSQRNECYYDDIDVPWLKESERYAVKTHQGYDLLRANKLGLKEVSGMMGFANACTKISAINVVSTIDETVSFIGSNGNVVMVGLAAVYLSIDAIINIRKYWKGEISGRRCCKNVLDTTFTMAGSIAGSLGGALVGSLAGPIGTLVGGVVGGILTAQAMAVFTDRLTQTLFGVPKSVALENAYKYFGVKMTADVPEINTAYRQKCLQHHPDKGGSKEEFYFVQLNMSFIKEARGCL